MVKLFANIAKKVPLPGIDFSSQQFGAALEVEVSDADPPEALKKRLRELYVLLSTSVEEQIELAAEAKKPTKTELETDNGCKECHDMRRKAGQRVSQATPAQKRAIHAIVRSLELDLNSILEEYNVTDLSSLTVQQASRVIDNLRSRQSNSDCNFDLST
jgi:hypothetical protein